MQDLGAAGITGAVAETAAHGGCGIEIDVSRVSRREHGMTPFEVMLSESQERMLVVVRRGAEERVRALFERWELHSDVIGRLTDDGLVRVRDGDDLVAEIPAALLSGGAPAYDPPDVLPPDITGRAESRTDPPFAVPADLGAALLELLAAPALCSRRSVYEQYDHMVQTNTIVPPGEGAAVLRVKGTQRGLALGLGANGRVCAADPYVGGAWIVAEACRNVACAGAAPLALTDCLNFGDPERSGVWETMAGVVEGIRAACLALDVPVISGNVSLYNETDGAAILPTPIVGVVGLLDDAARHARAVCSGEETLWLLGPLGGSLAGSEYARTCQDWEESVSPQLDLDLERRVESCVRELVQAGAVTAASDVAEGGLAVTLAELGLAGNTGVRSHEEWTQRLEAGELGRVDAVLFGEAPSRIIVGAPDAARGRIEAAAARWELPLTRLGVAGGLTIEIGSLINVTVGAAEDRWTSALDHLAEA
jgi:phosphoribosylformylglycinamidine synthase